MIKVSVLYANSQDGRFDMDYYCNRHIPMVEQKLGDACKWISVEQGLGGATPGSLPTYVAMSHLYFDSIEEFETALEPHAATIFGDIPNYTNIAPTIQISQVMM